MNIVGLHVGPVTGWATVCEGVPRLTGRERWVCDRDTLPSLFAQWAASAGFEAYGRVALLLPANPHPSWQPLHHFVLTRFGDKVQPVAPWQARRILGRDAATFRDYLRGARKSYPHLNAQTAEEALAVYAGLAASH